MIREVEKYPIRTRGGGDEFQFIFSFIKFPCFSKTKEEEEGVIIGIAQNQK